MAQPIEQTPILRGDDAKRFVAASNNPKKYKRPSFDHKGMSEAVKTIMCKGHEQK